MKYLKMLGLAAVAALAVMAVAGAGTASASQPKAELEAGQVFPVKITGHGGTGELTTVPDPENGNAVHDVHCESSTSTAGEIDSATTVKKVVVHFKGCTAFNGWADCTTAGRAEGEITTTTLKGTLVYLETNSSRAGVLLEPASGKIFAHFTCRSFFGDAQTLSVAEKVVGELTPVNGGFSNQLTLEFNETGGKQEPHGYLAPAGCAHTTAFLKSTGTDLGIGGYNFANLESGIDGDQTLTLDKKVKISSTKCA